MAEGWVLLPLKALSEAKSSFRGILTPEERKELVLCMLEDMLRVLSYVRMRKVVISPSRTLGTNALLLRPPGVIPLRFGGRSFPLHVEESLKAGIRPRIYRSPTVATDVDGVEDLLAAETLGLGTRTRDFLLSLGRNRFVR